MTTCGRRNVMSLSALIFILKCYPKSSVIRKLFNTFLPVYQRKKQREKKKRLGADRKYFGYRKKVSIN